jgi:hemin uptake protein HemP
MSPSTAAEERKSAATGATTAPARVSSESLLGPRGELLIVHNGREYRLRLTQNGKLILTA